MASYKLHVTVTSGKLQVQVYKLQVPEERAAAPARQRDARAARRGASAALPPEVRAQRRAVRRPPASDHGVRATARAPSRTPLSQSASALLNVKVCNLSIKVHQDGASADSLLPSSTLQQLLHLSFMLHACREWLYRQVSLLSGCLSRGSSTAARVLRQCRA